MQNPPEETLGHRIGQARRRLAVRRGRDVLQSDVATALGVGAATVSRWEAGQAIPREGVLAQLAKFLEVTPQYLRYGVGDAAADSPGVLMVGGLPVDVATVHTFTDEQVKAAVRAEAREEEAAARKAAPKAKSPPRRRRANG